MKKLIVLLALVVLISGCASSLMPWGIEKARNNLMKIENGMSKQEVLNIMGKPYKETYSYPDTDLNALRYLIKYAYGCSPSDSDIAGIIIFNGKVQGVVVEQVNLLKTKSRDTR